MRPILSISQPKTNKYFPVSTSPRMAAIKEKVKIDLYYDVISPYAWIAFESLLRYEKVWSIQVNLKPFSIRKVMVASGNRPPGEVRAKAVYMGKDIQRNNEYWNLKLKPPKDFMEWIKTKTSDTAMKLLLVVQNQQPEKLECVSREFWKRIWSNGQPIFGKEDFEKVLEASGIFDHALLLDHMNDASIEAKLEKNTSDAINSGAFGAPWIVVHKDGEEHAFFGSDRLHLIAHLLGENFEGNLTHLSKI